MRSVDAHAEAVDEVVRYYETNAVFARSGSGDRQLVSSAGIVAAAFDHRTSRAGDPLLHTHVVTANMTCTNDAGGAPKWQAIAGGGVFEHAKAAGHLYHAHMRRLLSERLGVEFGPVVNGYAEVVGVPDDVVRSFSKRRNEVEEVLAEAGNASARAAQVATLDTRHAKEYGVESETLEARWRAEAAVLGFGDDEIARCFRARTSTTISPPLIEALYDTLGGPHGLTERAATFQRTDVIEAVSIACGARSTAAEVEAIADGFLTSGRALLVDRSSPVQTSTDVLAVAPVKRSATQRTYTTPDLSRIEAQVLEWGTSGRRGAPDGVAIGRRTGSAAAARAVLGTAGDGRSCK